METTSGIEMGVTVTNIEGGSTGGPPPSITPPPPPPEPDDDQPKGPPTRGQYLLTRAWEQGTWLMTFSFLMLFFVVPIAATWGFASRVFEIVFDFCHGII